MAGLIPPNPVGVVPGSGLWNDWIEKIRFAVNTTLGGITFSSLLGKPTTLAGYGITDAQTKLNNSAGLAAALSDETGTGLAVFNTSPSLVTPALGAATATSLISAGIVEAAGASGFASTTFVSNARNPVWKFTNASTFGISYFQGASGIGSTDTIGMHFGTATAAGSDFRFIQGGTFQLIGGITTGNAVLHTTTTALTNGAAAALGTLTNAPIAGPPSKWVPINDNGTTRYIPTW